MADYFRWAQEARSDFRLKTSVENVAISKPNGEMIAASVPATFCGQTNRLTDGENGIDLSVNYGDFIFRMADWGGTKPVPGMLLTRLDVNNNKVWQVTERFEKCYRPHDDYGNEWRVHSELHTSES